jgi:16S rRNA (cytidine1402-2'-O)-methyltransferase
MSEGNIAPHSSKCASGLYLVATPIGNLEDITLRALRVLKQADIIACEDTRTSGVLLAHYGIQTPTVSYHEHNAEKMRPQLLAQLAAGEVVALISDAGTPLISDPGYKLSLAARAAGHVVIPIPGPSALLAALCGAGLPTDRFLFLGFLPPKSAARRTVLAEAAKAQATLIAYESPSRLCATLEDAVAVFGPEHPATVARELTKRFEEFRTGSLAELSAHYAEHAPRGEIVLVIAPADAPHTSVETCDALLLEALKTHSRKDAAALVSAQTGLPKREVYARVLALSPHG